ncbi:MULTISPECIES: tRNA epoxyqueuosine(34) reductase QueG [unclassified Idiomarina]|uniref:tRNA epoxyqueuosine(34) reductase QueG n=1 Tax=unclassified Idiomarina TaxID=2614829 RepID=UPI0025BFFC73|nr:MULTISPECIES: tRNA epoxyqueuosine(34) reductase QueG [unclassified Idiomarina]MEC7642771.1 tRNA epoxyqueuosine(34) reductase QueG [Pseudomonadota bacterium]MEC9320146.1 tRNA epoxyqueuosine(34) reductase QueG [Pseudomonadota bacterium]
MSNSSMHSSLSQAELEQLAQKIKQWGQALGFQKVGITDLDLQKHEATLQKWLDKGYHGEMGFMERHGMLRARPAELHPGSVRAISVRMNYLPAEAGFAKTLNNDRLGYISRYALGRDYHKLLRKRLKQLGDKIKAEFADTDFRPFVDSAPILERPLAEKAGLGWTGKHTLILDKDSGSWFFLGELLINLPLPIDSPVEEACGSCSACMTICPTQAIVAPYELDARRCISYLTIELKGSIPEELRPLMGNRIYGCDDCQLICPWNRYAQLTDEADFNPRHYLHTPELIALWQWDEETFNARLQGSPIRRIGHECWLRNIAVALGNAQADVDVIEALEWRSGQVSEMVQEHIDWALDRQRSGAAHVTQQLKRLVRAVSKGLPRDA